MAQSSPLLGATEPAPAGGDASASSTPSTMASASGGGPVRGRSKGIIVRRMDEIRVLGVLVVLVAIVTVFHPQFLSIASIANITQQASFFGIIALGMVFLLSMGELDLSVGGNFAFCAMVVALLVQSGVNPWLAALAAVAVGGCLGALNALLSNALRVPIIVISLGTLAAYRGGSLIISGAGSVSGGDPEDPFFTVLGGSIGGIPALSIAFLVLTVILTFVYTKTSFGFAVRAVGSNPDAARLSGYPIDRIRITVGALVGMLCGISGILSFAFFQASDPAVGTGYELLVVAAAVIGGTTLSGGRGSVVGAALGALIVSVINGALTAFGVSANYAGFVTGLVIVGAVALDSVIKRRKRP
jgi:ribose transport system permease protein